MNEISRRDFLISGALAAAGVVVAACTRTPEATQQPPTRDATATTGPTATLYPPQATETFAAVPTTPATSDVKAGATATSDVVTATPKVESTKEAATVAPIATAQNIEEKATVATETDNGLAKYDLMKALPQANGVFTPIEYVPRRDSDGNVMKNANGSEIVDYRVACLEIGTNREYDMLANYGNPTSVWIEITKEEWEAASASEPIYAKIKVEDTNVSTSEEGSTADKYFRHVGKVEVKESKYVIKIHRMDMTLIKDVVVEFDNGTAVRVSTSWNAER
ncbi:hypothetical protein JW962_01570 [Candidatus Dojkabacteria bacterium]|nr:hypothetical protein [Candidatus Dojkabacteria bacterium]